MTRAVLFSCLFSLACSPLDIDVLIELDPPEWTETAEGQACAPSDVREMDVMASAIREAALKGACLIRGNVVIDAMLGADTGLSGVQVIDGDLVIESGATGGVLLSLVEVTGRVHIKGSTVLEDGRGLRKLAKVGELKVEQTGLEGIAGLTALEQVARAMTLIKVADAGGLEAFRKLRHVGGQILLSSVGGLADVGALDALVHVDGITLMNVSGLTTFETRAALEVTQLNVSDCASLSSITLPGTRELQNISVMRNAELRSLSMPALEAVTSGFKVTRNPKLESIALPALTKGPPAGGRVCGNAPASQADIDDINARLEGEKIQTVDDMRVCPG